MRFAFFSILLASCAPGSRNTWVEDAMYAGHGKEVEKKKRIETLVHLLGDRDPAVADRASEELIILGPAAHPPLLLAVKYRRGEHGIRAVRCYARTGTARGLLEVWDRLSESTKLEAAGRIGRLGDPSLAPELSFRISTEPSADLRRRLLESLISWDDPRALPALLKALEDISDGVAETAVQGLAHFHAEEPLRRRLRDVPPRERARILSALGRMRAGRDVLLASLSDPSPEVRSVAISLLGPEDLDRIPPMLDDPSWTVFLAARDALSRLTGRVILVEGGSSSDLRRRTAEQWSRVLNK